jgi:hypothetical protein
VQGLAGCLQRPVGDCFLLDGSISPRYPMLVLGNLPGLRRHVPNLLGDAQSILLRPAADAIA